MKRRLEGKSVLVTGASSGIGQAIAIRFAQDGANVAINYRSGAEQVEATQATIRFQRNGMAMLESSSADVSSEDQVKRMFAEVIDEFGRLDAVVNNAGIQKASPSHEVDIADFDRDRNQPPRPVPLRKEAD